MQLTVEITNIYDSFEEITTRTLEITAPKPGIETFDEWAEDWIFPETGIGRREGDAGYFATITACEQMPGLVGKTFEWGI